MALMTGRDPLVRKLLEALGVADTRRVRRFVLTGGVNEVLTLHVEEFPDVTDRAKLEGVLDELAAAGDRPAGTPAWNLEARGAEVAPARVRDLGPVG